MFLRDNLISTRFGSYSEKSIVSAGEASILAHLLRENSATQAELTDGLVLSQQTISRMLSSLAGKNMISSSVLKRQTRRGQASKAFFINPDYAYSIGVAMRADGLTITLSNFKAEVIDTFSPEVEEMDKNSVISAIKNSIKKLSNNNKITQEQIFGVGVSTSGFHTNDNVASYNTPETLNDFALIDLDELFTKELLMPVWTENDGNAATIAENLCGAGTMYRNFAYYYFATGLGGGVVVNGSLFKGVHGNAGEYRAILPLNGFRPPTLENLRLHLNENGSNFKTVHELVNNYDDNLGAIDSWLKDILPSLSLMVSATSALLDTEAIVFGGLLPADLKKRMIKQFEFFDINRRGVKRKTAKVIVSDLRGDAAATGAAFLPFMKKFYLV